MRYLILAIIVAASSPAAEFKAGAFAADITPTVFPSAVNGSMKGVFATQVSDPMHARGVALHDGSTELILCVVDSCMIPREICEEAKRIAAEQTGVPATHMTISATHSHSCAAMISLFQSVADADYVAALPPRIAQGLIRAHQNLEPAQIAWGKDSDPTQVFCRRWTVKDGETSTDPFGGTTDRIIMNPGPGNPKVTGPSATPDTEVGILALRSAKDQRPLAVLANYSLHYVGGQPAISADYFGAFANELTTRHHEQRHQRRHQQHRLQPAQARHRAHPRSWQPDSTRGRQRGQRRDARL
jgi:neutral ceramidase